MSNEELFRRLVKVIERLNASGDSWGWPPVEIAGVAIRRWRTFARRHKRQKRWATADYVPDLAKGLQAHFEPDIPYTHPSDWRALAEALAQELQPVESSSSSGDCAAD